MRILFQTSIDYNNLDRSNYSSYVDSVGQNTGNLMFTTAVQWMIHKSGTHYVSEHVPWRNLQNYCETNEITHVIINCSNWVRPSNKSLLQLVNASIKSINSKIYFLGLGVNAPLHDYESGSFESLDGLVNEVAKLINHVEASGGFIGLRGNYSKEYFDNAHKSSSVHLTGCPSICQFNSLNSNKLAAHSTTKKITLNGAALLEDLEAIEQSIPDFHFVCQDWAIKPLYFFKEWREADSRRMLTWNPAVKRCFIENRMLMFDSVDNWTSYLSKNFNLSAGTRIHGGLAALFAGLPALFLTIDSRLAELTEMYGLPHMKYEDWDHSFKLLSDFDWEEVEKNFAACRTNFDDLCSGYGLPLKAGIRTKSNRLDNLPSTNSCGELLKQVKWIPEKIVSHRMGRFILAKYLHHRIN